MMEGYIFMPEEMYLDLHSQLKKARKKTLFMSLCLLGLSTLVLLSGRKGNEKEEKAG